MATGASTADVAILLVDARHGVRVQSRRHARIARLLGIQDFVLAINKMDLVDFDRDVYDNIRDDFEEILAGARAHTIPCSALHGDNVITRSDRTPWFDGPSLLEYLETVQVTRDLTALPFRFPVQLVLRPNHEFRGYAGQIAHGITRVEMALGHLAELAIGGTAVGTGVNTHPKFGARVHVADPIRTDLPLAPDG